MSKESKALAPQEASAEEKLAAMRPTGSGSAFASVQNFEGAYRMAQCLAASDLVPPQYANNAPNCILALEMSQRIGCNPLMVMQNLYMVHQKPAWSSQFLIACVNGCGNFSPLRYKLTGKEGSDERTCIAWALDKFAKERLESPPVSIRMAKQEGWFGKKGSKWPTMPELMLRYRAATYFARTYAPELTMGMHTSEEVMDMSDNRAQVEVKTVSIDMLRAGDPNTHQDHPKAKNPAAKKKDKQAPAAPAAQKTPPATKNNKEMIASLRDATMSLLSSLPPDISDQILDEVGIIEGLAKCNDVDILKQAYDAAEKASVGTSDGDGD